MDNATQKSSENELNQLNLAMRSQPWYQQFFQQRGLNPDQVKLNESQRAQLAQLANSNGYKIGDRMKIDPAGNINQKGGFAGMPTWAKVAITAAAIAGTGGALGAAGIGPMAGMMGGGGGAGVGAAGTGSGLAAAGGAAQGMSPLLMGTGGLTSLGGAAIPTLGSSALATGAGMAAMPSLAGSTAAGAGSMAGGLAGASGAASGGGSLISKFMGNKGQGLADAGKLFQSFANDEAGERYNQAGVSNQHDQLRLAAAANRRTDESDAMKKLSQAGYIKSGGSPFDASKVQLSGGRSLPSFSFPRAPITDEMKAGATTLEEQMLKRLQPDGSFTPTPNEAGNRGVGEQIGRFGSLATTGLGLLSNYFDRK